MFPQCLVLHTSKNTSAAHTPFVRDTMAVAYTSRSFTSLILDPDRGEVSASERMMAMISPQKGDNVAANNTQDISDQVVYPALCALKSGTDAAGLQRIVPDKIELTVTLGETSFVEQVVHATNSSNHTASMALYLARAYGNIVTFEMQRIGAFELERSIRTNSEADAIIRDVESNTTHTGSVAETMDNCTFVKLAKVPANTTVTFTSRTRLSDLNFAQLVTNDALQTQFADVAILLPITPVGAIVPISVSTVLTDKLCLTLPDKDAATYDAQHTYASVDAIVWMEDTSDFVLSTGVSSAVVVKYRVTKQVSETAMSVAHTLCNMSIDTAAHLHPSVVMSCRMDAGYDAQSGRAREVALVDIDVPPLMRVAPKTNDLEIFLVVDESGSTYMRRNNSAATNLEMAKRSAVAVLTGLVKEHIPLLRRHGYLSDSQRVFVSVFMFHHECRMIVSRLNVGDPSVSLDRVCASILADSSSGGTNFCAFATAIKSTVCTSPESLVVACILTDGGAHDMSAFIGDMEDLRSKVSDLRTVVVGFGAWVDEYTARRVQTDGHAMIADIDDTNVVIEAMRLLPRAIVSATQKVKITIQSTTVLSVVRTCARAGEPLAVRTTLSNAGDTFVTTLLLEPGCSVRLLCTDCTDPRISCDERALDVFDASTGATTDPVTILAMVDRMYLRAGVTLMQHCVHYHAPIVTAIGMTHQLGTSYTKPVAITRLPDALLAPAIANRPVAESLVSMMTPEFTHVRFCDNNWDGSSAMYRSLACATTTEDTNMNTASASGPPFAAQWLLVMSQHVDRLTLHSVAQKFNEFMVDLSNGVSWQNHAKRSRVLMDDTFTAGIDAASSRYAQMNTRPLNSLPLHVPILAQAQTCCGTLFVLRGMPAPSVADTDSLDKLRKVVEHVG